MTLRTQTILLAASIIAVALFLQSTQISNGQAMGIILGLSGAAVGVLSRGYACRKVCDNGAS